MNNQSEAALRSHGVDLAVGGTVAAAEDLKGAPSTNDLRARALELARTREIAVFALDAKGCLFTSRVSNGQAWDARRKIMLGPSGPQPLVAVLGRGYMLTEPHLRPRPTRPRAA